MEERGRGRCKGTVLHLEQSTEGGLLAHLQPVWSAYCWSQISAFKTAQVRIWQNQPSLWPHLHCCDCFGVSCQIWETLVVEMSDGPWFIMLKVINENSDNSLFPESITYCCWVFFFFLSTISWVPSSSITSERQTSLWLLSPNLCNPHQNKLDGLIAHAG